MPVFQLQNNHRVISTRKQNSNGNFVTETGFKLEFKICDIKIQMRVRFDTAKLLNTA